MTSPSRRKRPTTPPSTPPETAPDAPGALAPGRYDAANLLLPMCVGASPRTEPIWLPAGLLAALLTLTMALGALGGEVSDSGWATAAPSTGGMAAGAAVRARVAHYASPLQTSAGWRRPAGAPRPIKKGSVRLVAYEDYPDAAALRPAQQGSARLRSIVVKGAGQERTFRVAQQEEGADDELLRQFEQPFGVDQPPVEQPETRPGADELPPLGPTQPSPSDEPGAMQQPGVQDPFEADERDGIGELEDMQLDDLDSPGRQFEEMDDPDIVPAPTSDTEDARRNCAEELARLKASTIAQIDLSIRTEGVEGTDYPIECSIDDGTPFTQRGWPEVTYMWKASALCHKPLYFEQAHLERYGHSWGPCVQPLVSGAHFFTRLPVLPYCMGLTAPNECMYPLGYYRPGSCAPYMVEPIPFTWRAAAFEAAAWTGGVFVIP